MTRIIDMEVSVPRFDVGDDQAHTQPGRGAPAVDTERPAGYGMANYARIFKARQEGADHRPASELDTFMEMLGKLGVERALPFGVDNDEIAELLRRYPGRILGLVLPVDRVLGGVGVDRLVGTAVHGAVGLVVADEVDRAECDGLRADGCLRDRALRLAVAEGLRPAHPGLEQPQRQVHRVTVRDPGRHPGLDTVQR